MPSNSSSLRSGMAFVGVDLAWVPRNRTGLVAVVDGRVVDSTTAISDDEICAWLGPYLGGPVLLAVDAPVVVRNPAGTSRPCDRKITAVFGARHAGAHSANLGLASFVGGVRAERLALRLGLNTDPNFPAQEPVRRMIEVYPHPAMVSLFGLDFTLKYKAKRGRSVDGRRQAFAALMAHLGALGAGDPPLGVSAAPRWPYLGSAVAAATTDRQLDVIEDELDAFMCAYIGLYYWTHGAVRCRVVGDLETGYIVTPVTPVIGAAIDQLVLRRVVSRVRPAAATSVALRAPALVAPAAQVATSPTGLCGCGCGEPVRRRYLPGHDARHKESLIRYALAGEHDAELELEALGWTKFLDGHRAASERPG